MLFLDSLTEAGTFVELRPFSDDLSHYDALQGFVVSLMLTVSVCFLFLVGTQRGYILGSIEFREISTVNRYNEYYEPSPRFVSVESQVKATAEKPSIVTQKQIQTTTQKNDKEIQRTTQRKGKEIKPTTQKSGKETPEKKFHICTSTTGGIGNQMFEFAAGFGTAFNKNMKMVIGQNDLINKVFDLKNNEYLIVSKDKQECRQAKGRGEARGCAYDPNIVNFKPDASYNLGLYLQSWKYFNESSPELKKQLVFRDPVPLRAKQVITDVINKHKYQSREKVVLISIHVRRGDMVNNNYGYQVATKQYIEKAMDQFVNISNKIFIVCSNDMTWSKENIPQNKAVVEFITGNSREVDMAVLASCDHAIMTVGSFSWWAAWFVEGKKIYFKWPAKEGSPLRRQFSNDFMDFFYPDWTGF